MKSHGIHHKTDYNTFYMHCSRHNSVTVSFHYATLNFHITNRQTKFKVKKCGNGFAESEKLYH